MYIPSELYLSCTIRFDFAIATRDNKTRRSRKTRFGEKKLNIHAGKVDITEVQQCNFEEAVGIGGGHELQKEVDDPKYSI